MVIVSAVIVSAVVAVIHMNIVAVAISSSCFALVASAI